MQAGAAYDATAGFETLLESALGAYVSTANASTAAVARLPRRASDHGYSARDLHVPGFEKLNRTVPTEHEKKIASGGGMPVIHQKFGAAPLPDPDLGKFLTGNPLEWSANLYSLDRFNFRLDTRSEVEALQGSHTQVYARYSNEALDRLVIGAAPATRYLDIVGYAKGLLVGKIVGDIGKVTNTTTKSELVIPDDEPGIYMVRAFSGARFPPQAGLIDGLPGGRFEDTKMMALNIVLAVNDAIGMFASAKGVFPDGWPSFLFGLERSIAGALEVQAAQGTLDAHAIRAIFLTSCKAAYDWAVGEIQKGGLALLPKRLVSVLGSVINVSGKVSSAFKLAERINALSNAVQVFGDNVYTVQAVEDTLLVVGDPWAPVISGFQPRRAWRRDVVTLTGEGFSNVPENNIVTFGHPGTSPDNPPQPARAEVLTADYNSLRVIVPEEAETGIISVHVPDRGTSSTLRLDPPFQHFEVIPDPVISGFDPPVAEAGGTLRVNGEHFPVPTLDTFHNKVWVVFDIGGNEQVRAPVLSTGREILVEVPGMTGAANVWIRYGNSFGTDNRNSAAVPLTIQAAPLPPLGAEIRFSAEGDGNVRDGILTLREALMLKNGTLSYDQLTRPQEGDPPIGPYETNYITGGTAIGDGVRNRIVGYLGPGTHTVTLVDSLPPMASWTTLEIRPTTELPPPPKLILDGNGAATGLLLDGVTNTTVRSIDLKNFSEAAITLTGGSADNSISLCTVEGGDGDGIRLHGDARRNFVSVPVKGVGGHGYHLSGDAVAANRILIGEKPAGADAYVQGCGGWGIAIDGGAHLNRILAPAAGIFGQPPSGGLAGNTLGGILVTGDQSSGNAIHSMYSPGFPIRNNGGPGIRIESPRTTVHRCHISGNAGSGLEIFGTHAAGSRSSACKIGYDPQSGATAANGGHGIHLENTHDISFGEDMLTTDNFEVVDPDGIGANGGDGIHVKNCQRIDIRSVQIGRVPLASSATADLPNAGSGIVLDGSSDCVIGSSWFQTRVQITGHLDGNGILLSGTTCTNNTIIGCRIGTDPWDWDVDLGNDVGIAIVDGAWGNRLGMRGRGTNAVGASPMNYISFNRAAGVLLDSGGDPGQSIPPVGEPFTPEGGNIIVNNSITENHDAGILILSGAKANRIGGVSYEFNIINSNEKAGIRMANVTASRPEMANRIIGNGFAGNGIGLAGADPVTGAAEGVGILLENCVGQRIGGDRVAEGNGFQNSWVGIMVLGGSANHIAWNNIWNHRRCGVLLRDTESNRCGPGNQIVLSGVAGHAPLGGLVVSGGRENLVFENRLGSYRTGNPAPLAGDGIVVLDSPDNRIGGIGSAGNILLNASGHGIRLSGGLSSGNHVCGNLIGINPGPGTQEQPNQAGGVLLEGGASGNFIGGRQEANVNGSRALLPAGNTILGNGGNGVTVNGGTTLSNTITHNRISAHAGPGIVLGGGNRNLAAPGLTAQPGRVEGTSGAPDGSLVQYFHDPDGEGKTLLGETTVSGGQFEFANPPLLTSAELTATVSSATTGDTSPFASVIVLPGPLQLQVSRAGEPMTIATSAGASAIALPLELQVFGDEGVRVSDLEIAVTGNAAIAEAALYRDGNRNGMVDAGDEKLGPTLSGISPPLAFDGPLLVVQPGSPQRVVLLLKLAADAEEGQSLRPRVEAAASLTAAATIGTRPVAVLGAFPVVGDELAVGTPTAADFTTWAASHFSTEELATHGAPTANSDGDALNNIAEYFHGTDPWKPDGSPVRPASHNGSRAFVFEHADRPDLTWMWNESPALESWLPLQSATPLAPQPLGDGRVRETLVYDPDEAALFFRLHIERSTGGGG